MKRNTVRQEKIEEALRLLDQGFTIRDVLDQFSDAERDGVRAHLSSLHSFAKMKEKVAPPVQLLERTLQSISFAGEELPQPSVSFVTRFFGRSLYGRILIPAGAIAILGITLAGFRGDMPEGTIDDAGGEFAALSALAPEADFRMMQTAEKSAVAIGESDTADLFDETVILREGESVNEDLLAAQNFFERDLEVQTVLQDL